MNFKCMQEVQSPGGTHFSEIIIEWKWRKKPQYGMLCVPLIVESRMLCVCLKRKKWVVSFPCNKISIKKGKKVRVLVPVIHNLLFVHACPSEVKRIKSQVTYLQYITDTRSGQKIIISDSEMQRFIAVAGTYNDHLMYFQPDELNLSKGTKVRITGGDFEGQEGIFLKVKGARDRRVVVAIQGVIAVAMATIHPGLIEVIDS